MAVSLTVDYVTVHFQNKTWTPGPWTPFHGLGPWTPLSRTGSMDPLFLLVYLNGNNAAEGENNIKYAY